MTEANNSTRRSFLKGGALLAAPIAAASVSAASVSAAVLADDGLKARVQQLQSEAAIRELHQAWLRQINAGERDAMLGDTVRRIVAHHAGAPDKIDIAADGRSAVGLFDCVVESEAPLAEDCTLAQMARAQGNGTVRRSERRMLTVHYTNTGGSWKIARAAATTL